MKAKTNFIKIYHSIFTIEKLNINDIMILSILISINSNNENIYISDKKISELSNGVISPQTSYRCIKKLKKLNLISTSSKPNITENGYGGKTRFITISNQVLNLINGEIDTIKNDEPKKVQTIKPIEQIQNAKPVNKPIQVITEEEPISYNLKDILFENIDDNDIAISINNWFVNEKKYKMDYQQNVNLSTNNKELILSKNNLLQLLKNSQHSLPTITKRRLDSVDISNLISKIDEVLNNELIVA
jgi:hypothetical protein